MINVPAFRWSWLLEQGLSLAQIDCHHVTDSAELAEIEALRREVFPRYMPHLIEDGQVMDEADARAWHFVARKRGKLVGAVRMLPPPLEAARYFPDWASKARPNAPVVEMGRLVVHPEAKGGGILYAVVVFAIVWAIDHLPEYEGMIAYARLSLGRKFEQLGMRRIDEVSELVGKHPEPYMLLASYRDEAGRYLPGLIQALRGKSTR